jgi:hypothetical protein
MHFGATAIACIQDAANIDVPLLARGRTKEGINLIVKKRRFAFGNPADECGRRNVDRQDGTRHE